MPENEPGAGMGMILTNRTAGSTAEERIMYLALPPEETAVIETEVVLAVNQVMLAGRAAPQPRYTKKAADGIGRRGGAWIFVTDGGFRKQKLMRIGWQRPV